MTAKKSKRADQEAAPVVYCGPSIPGVANQFTVYCNGVPAGLEERAGEIPAIRGLLIPLDQLPEAMKKLRGGYGHIYRLHGMVWAKLNQEVKNHGV